MSTIRLTRYFVKYNNEIVTVRGCYCLYGQCSNLEATIDRSSAKRGSQVQDWSERYWKRNVGSKVELDKNGHQEVDNSNNVEVQLEMGSETSTRVHSDGLMP